jgi:anti-anti-sigma factor
LADNSPPYEIIVEPKLITVVFRPEIQSLPWGDLVSCGTEFEQELENRSRPHCLFDLSELDYMGSALVALIVRMWKGVQAKNGQMVIVCDHPVVLEVITLSGLKKVWDVAADHAEAFKILGISSKKIGQKGSETAPGDAGSTRSRKLLIVVIGIVLCLVAVLLYQSDQVNEFIHPPDAPVQEQP